jgi:hypothetical protein
VLLGITEQRGRGRKYLKDENTDKGNWGITVEFCRRIRQVKYFLCVVFDLLRSKSPERKKAIL